MMRENVENSVVANAAAAECNATLHLPGGDGFGQRDDKIGVVVLCIQLVRPEVCDRVP